MVDSKVLPIFGAFKKNTDMTTNNTISASQITDNNGYLTANVFSIANSFGFVDKGATGNGGTSLILNGEDPVIIFEPRRALANEKVAAYRAKGVISIEEALSDKIGCLTAHKKIVDTVDQAGRLFEGAFFRRLKEAGYKILVDEAEKNTEDYNFRTGQNGLMELLKAWGAENFVAMTASGFTAEFVAGFYGNVLGVEMPVYHIKYDSKVKLNYIKCTNTTASCSNAVVKNYQDGGKSIVTVNNSTTIIDIFVELITSGVDRNDIRIFCSDNNLVLKGFLKDKPEVKGNTQNPEDLQVKIILGTNVIESGVDFSADYKQYTIIQGRFFGKMISDIILQRSGRARCGVNKGEINLFVNRKAKPLSSEEVQKRIEENVASYKQNIVNAKNWIANNQDTKYTDLLALQNAESISGLKLGFLAIYKYQGEYILNEAALGYTYKMITDPDNYRSLLEQLEESGKFDIKIMSADKAAKMVEKVKNPTLKDNIHYVVEKFVANRAEVEAKFAGQDYNAILAILAADEKSRQELLDECAAIGKEVAKFWAAGVNVFYLAKETTNRQQIEHAMNDFLLNYGVDFQKVLRGEKIDKADFVARHNNDVSLCGYFCRIIGMSFEIVFSEDSKIAQEIISDESIEVVVICANSALCKKDDIPALQIDKYFISLSEDDFSRLKKAGKQTIEHLAGMYKAQLKYAPDSFRRLLYRNPVNKKLNGFNKTGSTEMNL